MYMEWSNLRNMNCPVCSEKLTEGKIGYICSDPLCDFRISFDKFQNVIKGMYSPFLYREDTGRRNERWLNDL